MTTVINFNILNFIGLNPRQTTPFNRAAFNEQHRAPSGMSDVIIDVTPSGDPAIDPSRVLAHNKQPRITYNRRGNPVNYDNEKGSLVDSYA